MIIVGTARIVCVAGSMQLSHVRPYVCPSVPRSLHPAAARRCCGFATVGPAARRYRSITARPADRWTAAAATQHGAQQQMRAVPRCQLTYEAEHRLVQYAVSIIYGTDVCISRLFQHDRTRTLSAHSLGHKLLS